MSKHICPLVGTSVGKEGVRLSWKFRMKVDKYHSKVSSTIITITINPNNAWGRIVGLLSKPRGSYAVTTASFPYPASRLFRGDFSSVAIFLMDWKNKRDIEINRQENIFSRKLMTSLFETKWRNETVSIRQFVSRLVHIHRSMRKAFLDASSHL